VSGDGRKFVGHFSNLVDGLLDSLPNSFASGVTSLEELLPS